MKEEKPKETLPYTCTPAYDLQQLWELYLCNLL